MSADLDIDGVLATARVIRSYLPDLLGPDLAVALDRQLADALAAPDSPAAVAAGLDRLLRARPETRAFLRAVLDDTPDYRPPALQPRHTLPDESSAPPGGISHAAPAGDFSPVDADHYTCPQVGCDRGWNRPDVATPVPTCPVHHVTLIRG